MTLGPSAWTDCTIPPAVQATLPIALESQRREFETLLARVSQLENEIAAFSSHD